MQIDAGKYILRKVTAYLKQPVDVPGGFMVWAVPQQMAQGGEKHFDMYILERIEIDEGRDAAAAEGGDIPAR